MFGDDDDERDVLGVASFPLLPHYRFDGAGGGDGVGDGRQRDVPGGDMGVASFRSQQNLTSVLNDPSGYGTDTMTPCTYPGNPIHPLKSHNPYPPPSPMTAVSQSIRSHNRRQ